MSHAKRPLKNGFPVVTENCLFLAFDYRLFGERGMEENLLILLNQHTCKHEKHRKYAERIFDILNGFEIVATRCFNCHKTIELTVRKLASY